MYFEARLSLGAIAEHMGQRQRENHCQRFVYGCPSLHQSCRNRGVQALRHIKECSFAERQLTSGKAPIYARHISPILIAQERRSSYLIGTDRLQAWQVLGCDALTQRGSGDAILKAGAGDEDGRGTSNNFASFPREGFPIASEKGLSPALFHVTLCATGLWAFFSCEGTV